MTLRWIDDFWACWAWMASSWLVAIYGCISFLLLFWRKAAGSTAAFFPIQMIIPAEAGQNEWKDEIGRYDMIQLSVHLDHAGVEVGTTLCLAWVVADAADCHYVQQAHQHRYQTAETHDPARSCHEVLKWAMAVLHLGETVYIKQRLPAVVQSFMSLNLLK